MLKVISRSPTTARSGCAQRGRAIRLTSVAVALFSIGLIAPAANGIGPFGPDAAVDTQEQDGFPRATYYRVTRLDPRLCPSPICGGVFVERVNKQKLRCPDGTRERECYVGIVDFSALGLSTEEEAQLHADFSAKRVLVRGGLESVEFGTGIEISTLVATDAWRGVTGNQGDRGRYFGVTPSGIVCITYPCPTLVSFKLNRQVVFWLHGIDLGSSGATSEQIGFGFSELSSGPGLIGFGRRRKIEGPAGIGRKLVTSEFYTKVEGGSSRACGGFTFPPNPSCEPREFCEQPAGTCMIADLPGTCEDISEACIEIYDPVCGCDGLTYSNDCHRQRAQAALDHPGACSHLPPATCGATTCAVGTTCCNPLLGICTPPGEACIL